MLRSFGTRALFAVTIFLAAALVFLVQPMIVKQLLPIFGGTPSVWNTAVVFFQVTLLLGYGIAHLSFRMLSQRRQPLVPLLVAGIALGFVPFAVRASSTPPDGVPPALWVGVLLTLSVGVPYLAVAMASPILQRWYAETGERGADNPYFLYTASNAGSLTGLLAFPFILEPTLSTNGQERVWAVGLVLYLLGVIGCILVLRPRIGKAPSATTDKQHTTAPATALSTRVQRTMWVALAAIPSSLMLGVTTYIATDIASAPMLWVVPLALYLLSFMLTFGHAWRVGPNTAGLLVALTTIALVLIELDVWRVDELRRVTVHLLVMLSAAVLAHALLYERRPAAHELTRFYLLISVGGAIGGAFTALGAPVLFERVYEYPLLLAAVVCIKPAMWRGIARDRSRPWLRALLTLIELTLAALLMLLLASSALDRDVGPFKQHEPGLLPLAAIGLAVLAIRRWGFAIAVTTLLALLVFGGTDTSITSERNFFGTLRVDRIGITHRLLQGTTLHGAQFMDEREFEPTSYYTRQGPIGDAFKRFQLDEPLVDIGVVGLGSGTVAGYATTWQRFTFYEIDPAVIRVAENPTYFTWLQDARKRATVRVVEGDARLELRDFDGKFDLLVLDAYSSDAVPVHLLTTEAFELYADKLKPGGRILLHISSRHLNLEDVVAANAQATGLAALQRIDSGEAPEQIRVNAAASHWVALAPDADSLDPLRGEEGWRALDDANANDAWTDDFSNIAGAITWLRGNR